MSILSDLASRTDAKIGEGEWVARVVAAGRKETERLPSGLRPAALAALAQLEADKAVVGRIGASAFVAIVSRLALGQEDEARVIFLRDEATFDQRMAAMDAASQATVQEKRRREEAWDSAKQVAQRILSAAGKIAVPLLLAAI